MGVGRGDEAAEGEEPTVARLCVRTPLFDRIPAQFSPVFSAHTVAGGAFSYLEEPEGLKHCGLGPGGGSVLSAVCHRTRPTAVSFGGCFRRCFRVQCAAEGATVMTDASKG